MATKTKRRTHSKAAYKSGFEERFQEETKKEFGWELPYEAAHLKYTIPAKNHRYTPDFKINDKCFIETKGLWTTADRKKALLIKEQFPDVKILYVLYRNNKIFRTSSTTYIDWAESKGLKACLFSETGTWKKFIIDNRD